MCWHRTSGAQLSPSLRPEPGFFYSGLLLMSRLVKFHLAVQELVELGEGELTENTCFFFQVNAFFRYCFWSSLKTELLLCINTLIVILYSCTGYEGKDEGQSWTWGETHWSAWMGHAYEEERMHPPSEGRASYCRARGGGWGDSQVDSGTSAIKQLNCRAGVATTQPVNGSLQSTSW